MKRKKVLDKKTLGDIYHSAEELHYQLCEIDEKFRDWVPPADFLIHGALRDLPVKLKSKIRKSLNEIENKIEAAKKIANLVPKWVDKQKSE